MSSAKWTNPRRSGVEFRSTTTASLWMKFLILLIALSLPPGRVNATQYGSPTKVVPFTLPCCVTEMAVVDLNGDGFEDVIAASFYYPIQNAGIPVQILLNNGQGGFVDGTSQIIVGNVPTTVQPRKILIADFNGDNWPDVFIADHGYDNAPYPGAQGTLLLSTGDGHLVDATANLPQELAFTHSATAADIDGSGRIAIYMGNIYGQQQIGPQLLLNDGTGRFTISSGRLPSSVTNIYQNLFTQSQFVDVTGDGCPDLVLGGFDAGISNSQSVVLVNDCQGFFSVLSGAMPAKPFSDGITLDIRPVKLSGSGSWDLLLVSTDSSYVGRAIQVLINNGNGTFQDQSAQRLGFEQSTGAWIEWAFLADTTGQCRLDIFPQFNDSEVMIFLNDGTGHFTSQSSGLPNVFGGPYPIDLNATGQTSFISLGGDGYYVTPVVGGTSCINNLHRHDFNRDSRSDIVWQDGSGDVGLWLMNGAAVSSSGGFGGVPANWSIVGQRDFDGDGKYDLLWRDTSGNIAIWFMDGTHIRSSAGVGNIPMVWTVVATGDFNGDGLGDIMWRDNAGDVGVWLMNGGSVSSSAGLGNVPGTWSVVGTGDFNGDGKSDLLWSDTNGNTAIWFMNGTQVGSSAGIGNIPTNWSVVGTGDFNADGNTDLIWRDGTGDTAVWLMVGANVSSAQGLGNIPIAWSIVQIGDYNGDGKSDLLWRDSSGDTAVWFMNGTRVASTALVGNIATNWTVQSVNAE
jgi:hypothetical protein